MKALTIKPGQSKKTIKNLFEVWASKRQKKGLDAKKFSGVITLKEDPKIIQKRFRNEWD